MRLHDLKPAPGSRKERKRVGRGPGSGWGKTAGKGHKGQKARSGAKIPPWFEGGQMPLIRRIPKRGFTNIFRKEYAVVNLRDLNRFPANAEVGPDELKQAGLVKKIKDGIKLLADGELKHPLTIKVHRASEAAIQKVQQVGGTVSIIS
ncbi:50S ribosomal protein L15 [Thermodesulforhabdus norvegica]|uniref:50S ribosomal protein L15 n=1 Tax=Thermodesulforhabdus norvegica TaxID=39841 RepID=UPI000B894BDF|nr:50S ribosomal protein L15 [Thermodesulforhabdus norvegica]